ncbi:vitamin B12-dependent ribonucleotide reductase [Patescibacteria group bacterium]|nr:vitamin B12-dependent ribonucleotide reductase [Patescibacteria group bacterium]
MALMQAKAGLVSRYFTNDDGQDVFNEVEWGKRRAYIFDSKENKALIDLEVEAPVSWSDTAVNIAAYKYFRKKGLPTPEGRELSVKQMISRVALAITQAGEELKYFDSAEAKVFQDEITHILLHQKAAFNSPVWFNVGMWHAYGIERISQNFYYNYVTGQIEVATNAYKHPQCSACFIQSVDDSLEGIFELLRREARLFKFGSGTGSNFSNLRSRFESLSNGGNSSGMMSFLKVFDAGAGTVKSGGTTRRAAKMVIVDIDHPEIEDFIKWKAKEEDKALALIREGYDADFNGEAYHTVSGQNSNNSVRVSDDFMQSYLENGEWSTKLRTTGEVHRTYKARELMRMISEAAWRCADPGMQYDTTVNRWHTCKVAGRINASNPCSEFMFLNDTACNLASLNLVKFMDAEGNLDIVAYRKAIELIILAQEILVDFASYTYEEMARQSHLYRPLGMGYANLGAYLMRQGLAYDSASARGMAAALAAIMTGRAYAMSAQIAAKMGAFPEYQPNADSMLEVIKMHKYAANSLTDVPVQLQEAAVEDWQLALTQGELNGYRNAQVTVLAPTGTIGPLMDVDTTGIEPDFALVKYKKLAGGGGYSIVNQSVEPALKQLGYTVDQIEQIKQHILEKGTIEGAPELKEEHLSIFDCANKCNGGTRFIQPMAHVEMMAAVQPFISGAISKTVNMPEEATVEEIEQIYVDAWRKGLKAIAIYRDNSKSSQPLTSKQGTSGGSLQVPVKKRELPKTRSGLTHKVVINGQHKIFITANQFENGELGEIFINAGKEGSVVSGLLSAIARLCSKMLQEGAPAETIVKSFINLRFDPWGMTDNQDIPTTKSIADYIGRWLGMNFLSLDRQVALGIINGHTDNSHDHDNGLEPNVSLAEVPTSADQPVLTLNIDTNSAPASSESDYKYAPICPTCGALMVRSGTCFACKECATTTGCS